ncbi:hypothetical protein [Helicobacter sp. 23-1045]
MWQSARFCESHKTQNLAMTDLVWITKILLIAESHNNKKPHQILRIWYFLVLDSVICVK